MNCFLVGNLAAFLGFSHLWSAKCCQVPSSLSQLSYGLCTVIASLLRQQHGNSSEHSYKISWIIDEVIWLLITLFMSAKKQSNKANSQQPGSLWRLPTLLCTISFQKSLSIRTACLLFSDTAVPVLLLRAEEYSWRGRFFPALLNWFAFKNHWAVEPLRLRLVCAEHSGEVYRDIKIKYEVTE